MAQLDAIGLVVADLERAVAFYRHLGLEFGDVDGQEHVEAATPGGIRLMLDTEAMVESFSDWTPPTGGSPRTGLAFLCDGADEIDRLCGRLVEAGGNLVVAPFDAHWGQRYATVHDPDGNAVDLFAPL